MPSPSKNPDDYSGPKRSLNLLIVMYAFMAMTGVVVAVGYVIKGQPLFSGIWTAFGAAWAYRVWRTPAWRSDQGD